MTKPLLNFTKYLLLSIFFVLFLIGTSLGLRLLCTPARATETSEYILLTAPTPLYSTNSLNTPIITLPTGYHAQVLSSSSTVARVEYNGITGFISLPKNPTIIQKVETPYQTAQIQTKSNYSTFIRTSPSTNSEKRGIVPASTPLIFIGEIVGETPTDGTTANWFYVHYELGPTTLITGYVYAERIDVLSGKIDRVVETQTTATTTTEPKPEQTDLPTPSTQLSSGLKVFLIILFSTLGIIIFALLLISPKNKHSKRTPTKTRKRSSLEYSARTQPEFGELIDFSQPTLNKKEPKIQKFTSIEGKKSSGNLPKSIARYFKTEQISPPDPDDLL